MKKMFVFVAFIPTFAFGADDCATMRHIPETELSLQEVIKMGLCRNPQTQTFFS